MTTVHINPLRWFVAADGGVEFVRSHGNDLDEAVAARALTARYPRTREFIDALRAAGIGAERWYTLGDDAPGFPALDTARGESSLGFLVLAGGDEPWQVTAMTSTDPHPEAIPLAAYALTAAFGPQVVWADDFADVMLVRSDMTLDQVRTRWQPAG